MEQRRPMTWTFSHDPLRGRWLDDWASLPARQPGDRVPEGTTTTELMSATTRTQMDRIREPNAK